MPFYKSPDSLYTALRAMFTRIEQQTPDALNALNREHLILRFRCTAPAAEIVLNGRQRGVPVSYGGSTLCPDLDVELTADTLHQILSDTLSMKKAVANGQIKIKGPVWKMSVVIAVVKAGREFYPAILKQYKLS